MTALSWAENCKGAFSLIEAIFSASVPPEELATVVTVPVNPPTVPDNVNVEAVFEADLLVTI